MLISPAFCHTQTPDCYPGDYGGFNQQPTITGISPNVWAPGQTYTVVISGSWLPALPAGCTTDLVHVYENSSYPYPLTKIDPYVTVSNITPVSSTQTNFTVTIAANAPTENDAVDIKCSGPGCGNWDDIRYGAGIQTPAPPAPSVTLQRLDLMDIQATGTPTGGTFSLSTQKDTASTTSTYATIDFASGSTSSTNPTTLELTEPANPSPKGSYSPGGLEDITVSYTTAGGTANDEFEVPTFGMSCYDTTLQSDWGTAPNNCQTQTIHKVKYSGTVTNPAGMTGTYCSAFIAQVKLQGQAYSTEDKTFSIALQPSG